MRERIARERLDWVVIRRTVEWRVTPYFYAFRPDDLLAWIDGHADRLEGMIEDVLDLRKSRSSVVTRSRLAVPEIPSGSHDSPVGRAVRLDGDGRPTAVGEPDAIDLGTPRSFGRGAPRAACQIGP